MNIRARGLTTMQFPAIQVDYTALARELGSPQFCEHRHYELRYKTDKNNKKRFHQQCLACGSPVGVRLSASKVLNVDSVPCWDDELPKQVWSSFRERMDARRESEVQRALTFSRKLDQSQVELLTVRTSLFSLSLSCDLPLTVAAANAAGGKFARAL